MAAQTRAGHGRLTSADRDLGEADYILHLDPSGRVHIVQFAHRPDDLSDGDRLLVRMDDGRILECQVIDDSPYCAVVGDGPRHPS